MSRMRLLDLVVPFSYMMPEVQFPYHKVDQVTRITYTISAAFLFVVLGETSLYGIKNPVSSPDPIPWLRSALGMSHGTLGELGVVPIILSGMTFQMLAGARKIKAKLDTRKDRMLFQTAQKFCALLISLILSFVVAFGSNFDATFNGKLIAAGQIFTGSALTIIMDEILSKGYGLGSGLTVFSTAKATQHFFWALASLENVMTPIREGWHTYGVIPSLFSNFTSRSFKFTVTEAVFRTNGLPNIFDITVAVVVFMIAAYLCFIRIDLQIRSTKMRAQSSQFPVKMLYTGSLPLFYAAALLAIVHIYSFALSNLVPDAKFLDIVGRWDPVTGYPVSGLASLLTPYLSTNLAVTILRLVVYTSYFVITGTIVAKKWTRCSGFSPDDIAKQFKDNAIVLVGKRDASVAKELKSVIPAAAALGGLSAALCASLGDLLGPAGWGLSMTIAAINGITFLESLAYEGFNMPTPADLM